MVQDQAELVRIQVQLQTVFTPGAPVSRRDLLAGRHEEIAKVIGAVSQTGRHAVIFGERGVGKTSLAGLVHEIWMDIAKDFSSVVAPRVNCDAADDYQSVWAKVADEILVQFEKRSIDADSLPGSQPFRTALAELEVGSATPALVRRALDLSGYRLIVVLDEFDRMEDETSIRLLADTIKMLSDHWVDATIIVVGVADTVDQLFEEHASIDRSTVQVLVPRMSQDELAQIVDGGLSTVGMTIQLNALHRITSLAQGLPHYAHVLGLSSAQEAIRQRRRDIYSSDVHAGLGAALDLADESIKSAYYAATVSPRKENLYKQVLLACAMAPVDDLGYFAPADVREPMSLIMGRAYDIPSFVRHLRELCTENRGKILQQSGEERRSRYRFRNPLLQPYVLLRGRRDGMLTDDQ